MTEQFSSMERDAFHVSYLSDKIPEAVFHGQAVKTVAYLRVSTAQNNLVSLSGHYLSSAEREEIAIRHAQGFGIREVARQIRRCPQCCRFCP